MSACLAGGDGLAGAPPQLRRLAVAVLLAAGLHAAAAWRFAFVSGTQVSSANLPQALSVRMLSVPPLAALSPPEQVGVAPRESLPTKAAGEKSRSAEKSGTVGETDNSRARRDATAAISQEPIASPTGPPGEPAGGKSRATLASPAEEAAAQPPSLPAHEPASLATLPPAPAYLASARLDPGPMPLQDIDPVYPEEAGLTKGLVVLRLLIDERGIVDDVAVVRATPHGLFESSALAAFSSAKFSPGRMLGVPVKSQLTIEVEFTPINRGATVSGRSY